jgi:anthranilate phosphoribosyltransferase
VNADDGLDELSLGAPSTLHHVQGTTQWEERIDAGDLLGRRYSVSDIRGGDAEANARAVRNYLEGRRDAVFDVACANAALGLMVAGAATDFIDGFEKATHSVLSGAAATALEKLVATSQG